MPEHGRVFTSSVPSSMFDGIARTDKAKYDVYDAYSEETKGAKGKGDVVPRVQTTVAEEAPLKVTPARPGRPAVPISVAVQSNVEEQVDVGIVKAKPAFPAVPPKAIPLQNRSPVLEPAGVPPPKPLQNVFSVPEPAGVPPPKARAAEVPLLLLTAAADHAAVPAAEQAAEGRRALMMHDRRLPRPQPAARGSGVCRASAPVAEEPMQEDVTYRCSDCAELETGMAVKVQELLDRVKFLEEERELAKEESIEKDKRLQQVELLKEEKGKRLKKLEGEMEKMKDDVQTLRVRSALSTPPPWKTGPPDTPYAKARGSAGR